MPDPITIDSLIDAAGELADALLGKLRLLIGKLMDTPNQHCDYLIDVFIQSPRNSLGSYQTQR